jgi:LDH2 family malate/lactate/ureidoglycolate dehydrogenase
VKVASQRLMEIAEAVLAALGASHEESALVARSLVWSDMRGIPTHGTNFLTKIVDRIEKGVLDLPTRVTVLSTKGATAHFDGGNGFGQVAADQAMRMSIDLARKHGVGVSLVRNTNHIGILAFYTHQAAREGMLGLCTCNAAASMAPTGGAEAFMGTNPLSIALPSGDGPPVLVDMSTSVVARGKIRRALAKGQEIPAGWALDERGRGTTNPQAAMNGSLLPIAGPKGYALALFIDLIAGLLSGSKYGREVLTFHKPLGPTGVGVMTMALDIGSFMAPDQFTRLVSDHADSIRGSRRAEGVERIYLPGEIEFEREEISRSKGVELDQSAIESLNQLLNKFNIRMPPLEG